MDWQEQKRRVNKTLNGPKKFEQNVIQSLNRMIQEAVFAQSTSVLQSAGTKFHMEIIFINYTH